MLCIARKRKDIYLVLLFYPFLPIFPLACSRRWDSWVRRESRTVTSYPFAFFSAHISLRSSRSERLQLYNCSLRNRRLEVSGRKKELARARETRVSPSRAPVLSCAHYLKRESAWDGFDRVVPLSIETFRFCDENDYENKIFSIVNSAREWGSVIATSYQMLQVLAFCNQPWEGLSFKNDNSAYFSGEKKKYMKNSGVSIVWRYAKKL